MKLLKVDLWFVTEVMEFIYPGCDGGAPGSAPGVTAV